MYNVFTLDTLMDQTVLKTLIEVLVKCLLFQGYDIAFSHKWIHV